MDDYAWSDGDYGRPGDWMYEDPPDYLFEDELDTVRLLFPGRDTREQTPVTTLR